MSVLGAGPRSTGLSPGTRIRPAQSRLPGFASPVQFLPGPRHNPLLSLQGKRESVPLATAQQLHCWQSMCVLTGQKSPVCSCKKRSEPPTQRIITRTSAPGRLRRRRASGTPHPVHPSRDRIPAARAAKKCDPRVTRMLPGGEPSRSLSDIVSS